MSDSFYEYLKIRINESGDEVDKCVTYLPDIFKTLSGLLDHETLLQEDRLRINAALAYIVVPNDVIPEEVYGTWGYFDDLFVGARVLKEMHQKYPDAVLKRWEVGEDFVQTLDFCLLQATHFLEEKDMTDKVLDFAGLR